VLTVSIIALIIMAVMQKLTDVSEVLIASIIRTTPEQFTIR
jgi:hypothetical protein